MKTFSFLSYIISSLMLFSCQDDEMPGNSTNNPTEENPSKGEKTTHTIDIQDYSFSPENLTVNIGDTVTWINKANMVHTTTSGTDCGSDEKWNSGNLSPEQTFSYVFTQEGSFEYFCIPHCTMGMTGNITVED